jgi:hypothetical protein
MNVSQGFKQTAGESNRWGVFSILEFVFDTRSEPYQLLFNEETEREKADFREL